MTTSHSIRRSTATPRSSWFRAGSAIFDAPPIGAAAKVATPITVRDRAPSCALSDPGGVRWHGREVGDRDHTPYAEVWTYRCGVIPDLRVEAAQ